MRILIADDERVSRRMLETILTEWGYEVTAVADGEGAWDVLRGEDAPKLAILDWIMPGVDGLEVCQRVRALKAEQPPHLILLTVKGSRQDLITGLEAGAADYIAKPFDLGELKARLNVGRDVVELRRTLAGRVRELEEALERVKQLQGLLPICSYCKNIRDDHHYWHKVESYIAEHSGARFSHAICPDCWNTVIRAQLKQLGVDAPEQPAAESGE